MNGDKKKIIVPGSFDLLHYGHIRFLKWLKELNVGEVHVALGTDDYQTQYKREPIQKYWERQTTLEVLSYVDAVHRRDKPTIEGLFQTHDFDFIACGSDWGDDVSEFLRLSGLSFYYLQKHDIGLIVAPTRAALSTTELINRIIERREVKPLD